MNEYKYDFKPGDNVLIKHTDNKTIEDILKGTDRIVTLIEESEGGFLCEKNEVRWYIEYHEIAGYGFDYNQWIQVSHDGEKWDRTSYRFLHYGEGTNSPWVVSNPNGPACWRYARPVQKEEPVKEKAKLTLSERSVLLLEDFLRMSKEDTDEIKELLGLLEQSRESLKNLEWLK